MYEIFNFTHKYLEEKLIISYNKSHLFYMQGQLLNLKS